MITWRTATVVSHAKAWTGAQELDVKLHTPLPGRPDDPHATVRALAYTQLVGTPHPGDHVLLNVSALARGLGTGGYALVVTHDDNGCADFSQVEQG